MTVICACGKAIPAREILDHECDPKDLARMIVDQLRAAGNPNFLARPRGDQ